MARVAQTDAQNASTDYGNYAKSALTNYNSEVSGANDDISTLEGNNPYTSKSNLQAQNLLSSGAMNSTNAAAKQNLQDTALRTGTNTAALGRTIASNSRAGQRQMDQYNAQVQTNNTDKATQLQENLIGDRTNLANSEGNIYGTSANAQTGADGQLVTLNGQNQQMWGQILAGAAGAAGASFAGKG